MHVIIFMSIYLSFYEKVIIISKYFILKINNFYNPSLLEIISVYKVKIMREIIYSIF